MKVFCCSFGSLQCVDLVFDELQRVCTQCETLVAVTAKRLLGVFMDSLHICCRRNFRDFLVFESGLWNASGSYFVAAYVQVA